MPGPTLLAWAVALVLAADSDLLPGIVLQPVASKAAISVAVSAIVREDGFMLFLLKDYGGVIAFESSQLCLLHWCRGV